MRQNKLLPGILAFLCALSLLLGAPRTVLASFYPEKPHSDLDYSEYDCRSFDDTALLQALSDLEGLCGKKDPLLVDDCLEKLSVLDSQWGLALSWYTWLELRTYADIYDEKAAADIQDAEEALTILSDEISRVLHLVLESPYADEAADYLGEGTAESFREYEPLEDWELEFNRQETALVQRYYQEVEADPGVDIEGDTWTWERFFDSPPMDSARYYRVLDTLSREQNDRCIEILRELIRLRNDAAKRLDYDDYCALRDELYARDYGPDDLTGVYREVKASIVPLWSELDEYLSYSDAALTLDELTDLPSDEILDRMETVLPKIHPDLMESFESLRSHHLYDTDYRESKADVGFTTDFRHYGTAFIFLRPSGDYHDLASMVHEFGHFNASFHGPSSALADSACLDVAEIQSQGLEVLSARFAEDLAGPAEEGYRLSVIADILSAVIDGCFYDELQRMLYANPDWSAEQINRLAYDLAMEYGYPLQSEERVFYGWVTVSHTFDSPLYYISYTTSGLSALDIAGTAETDWEQAVDRYMKISAASAEQPYREVLRSCGMRDIFEPGNIRAIAEEIRSFTNLQTRMIALDEQMARDERLFIIILAAAVLLLFALIVGIALLVRRLVRKIRLASNAALADETFPTSQEGLPEWQDYGEPYDSEEFNPFDRE